MRMFLTTKTNEEATIKNYLEANASDILVGKINDGVRIEKDGKTLINRKTIETFMKYAYEEARKAVEKNARVACIDNETVFGWAIHYFEEPDIIGTLFNEDGTEHKVTPPPVTPKPVVPAAPPKPTGPRMMSFFDLENETKLAELDNEIAELNEEVPV